MAQSKNMVSRRSFIAGTTTAAAAATVAGTAALAGASEAETTTMKAQYSFEIAPDPIPESEITKTYEADLIVVGAGY